MFIYLFIIQRTVLRERDLKQFLAVLGLSYWMASSSCGRQGLLPIFVWAVLGLPSWMWASLVVGGRDCPILFGCAGSSLLGVAFP